jgi:hypothetical protein
MLIRTLILSVMTGRFPVNVLAAKADVLETSARLHKLLDLQPKILHCLFPVNRRQCDSPLLK